MCGMTPLEYLKSRGRPATEELCQQAGTTIAYFEQIAYGWRRPSPELAKRLAAGSNGDLDAAEMVFAELKQPPANDPIVTTEGRA
jgi:hypothetical protein